jgi:hypothetical protein
LICILDVKAQLVQLQQGDNNKTLSAQLTVKGKNIDLLFAALQEVSCEW